MQLERHLALVCYLPDGYAGFFDTVKNGALDGHPLQQSFSLNKQSGRVSFSQGLGSLKRLLLMDWMLLVGTSQI